MFEESIETQIKAVNLVDGAWYVRLDGDMAGKVVGAVYDASAGDTDLVHMPLSVSFIQGGLGASCGLSSSCTSSGCLAWLAAAGKEWG